VGRDEEDRGDADRGDEESRADEDGLTGRTEDGPPERDCGTTSAGTETGRNGKVSASRALRPIRGRGRVRVRVFDGRASARSRRRTLAIAPASSPAPPQMSTTPRSIMAFDRSPTMG
jgi:hypothetical protein